ncbi:MAG: iron-sulfur cluster assembly scaffold protein [Candidatus Pacebacteria bacterium]|nr:iron-sulfur cluster assembly scaffold protein [Candidatus Paceibacterota bacterium]
MDDLYLAHILEHAKHPHNHGQPDSFDIREDGINPNCGDEITLYVTFAKNGTVENVQFTGDGCAISMAATSLLTDKVKNMSSNDISALTEKDINDLLHININPGREKCALLALRTLQKALREKAP